MLPFAIQRVTGVVASSRAVIGPEGPGEVEAEVAAPVEAEAPVEVEVEASGEAEVEGAGDAADSADEGE